MANTSLETVIAEDVELSEQFRLLSQTTQDRIRQTSILILEDVRRALYLDRTQTPKIKKIFDSGMALVMLIEIVPESEDLQYAVVKSVSGSSTEEEKNALKREAQLFNVVSDIIIPSSKTPSTFPALLYPENGIVQETNGNYMLITDFRGINLDTEFDFDERGKGKPPVIDKLLCYLRVAQQLQQLFDRDLYPMDLHDGNILWYPDDPRSASLTDLAITLTAKDSEYGLVSRFVPVFELVREFTYGDGTKHINPKTKEIEYYFTEEQRLLIRSALIRTLAVLAFKSLTGLLPYNNLQEGTRIEDVASFQFEGRLKYDRDVFGIIDDEQAISALSGVISSETVTSIGPAKVIDIAHYTERKALFAEWMDRVFGRECVYATRPEGIILMMQHLIRIVSVKVP